MTLLGRQVTGMGSTQVIPSKFIFLKKKKKKKKKKKCGPMAQASVARSSIAFSPERGIMTTRKIPPNLVTTPATDVVSQNSEAD